MKMHIKRSSRALLGSFLAFLFVAPLLAGCGKKAEPSAPGYYEGPMKPKTSGTKAPGGPAGGAGATGP